MAISPSNDSSPKGIAINVQLPRALRLLWRKNWPCVVNEVEAEFFGDIHEPGELGGNFSLVGEVRALATQASDR